MKNILKTGTIVEIRDGSRYLVVNDCLIGYLSHMYTNKYNEDLTYNDEYQRKYTAQTERTIHEACSRYDIMKIWIQRDMSNLSAMLESDWINRFCTLIYDRDNTDDTVEMTVEEICKALGRNVKVVKE